MTSFFGDLLLSISERGRMLIDRGQTIHGDAGAVQLAELLLTQKGEASGLAIADKFFEVYASLDEEQRAEFFSALSLQFGPDLDAVSRAIAAFEENPDPVRATALHGIAEPRRQELIRRLNRTCDGTRHLVKMRADLLDAMQDQPDLKTVDQDFDHLLTSWFNRGFLVLEPITWSTPANILEKIIAYEAVHEIQSWDDLRRRIEPADRRCYAFFHPALTDEPLIFVEVALTNGIADAIAPILADDHEVLTAQDADTAVFYSISNCQRGLKGVSFGNFLIKQVAQELVRELPQLKTFVTLSPVPTFMKWLDGVLETEVVDALSEQQRDDLAALKSTTWHCDEEQATRMKALILPLAGSYFLNAKHCSGKPFDPVERFHLGNGARLERVNWLGDTSPKGLAQAAGLMVNYIYDLDQIEKNHEAFAEDDVVAASKEVKALAKQKAAAAMLEAVG